MPNTACADRSLAMSSRTSSTSSASSTPSSSRPSNPPPHRRRTQSRPRRDFGPPIYTLRNRCVERFDFEFRFNNIPRRTEQYGNHVTFACHRCKYKFCQKCDVHTCKPSQETKLLYTFGVRKGQLRRRGKIELRWRNARSCSRWRRAVHWAQRTMLRYSRWWLPLIVRLFLWRLLGIVSFFLHNWALSWALTGFRKSAVEGIDVAVDYGEHWGITRPKWRRKMLPPTAKSY